MANYFSLEYYYYTIVFLKLKWGKLLSSKFTLKIPSEIGQSYPVLGATYMSLGDLFSDNFQKHGTVSHSQTKTPQVTLGTGFVPVSYTTV